MDFKDRSRPFVATDAIIFIGGRFAADPKIVLIERKNKPLGYALPGGYVEYGESLEDCVRREIKEEVDLDVVIYEQFYTYSLPTRDPRSHTMSTVFICGVGGDEKPIAGDDAAKAHIVSVDEALELDYAFDHKMIIKDVIRYLDTGFRRQWGA